MTQVAAETLGVPLEQVRAELGDSTMPKAPVSGGSQSSARRRIWPKSSRFCQSAIGRNANFPVNSLFNREFVPETGSLQTASTTIQSLMAQTPKEIESRFAGSATKSQAPSPIMNGWSAKQSTT